LLHSQSQTIIIPLKKNEAIVFINQLQMMWGDAGVASFYIRPDDLARKEFTAGMAADYFDASWRWS
jgi:uncharacterized protein YwqG